MPTPLSVPKPLDWYEKIFNDCINSDSVDLQYSQPDQGVGSFYSSGVIGAAKPTHPAFPDVAFAASYISPNGHDPILSLTARDFALLQIRPVSPPSRRSSSFPPRSPTLISKFQAPKARNSKPVHCFLNSFQNHLSSSRSPRSHEPTIRLSEASAMNPPVQEHAQWAGNSHLPTRLASTERSAAYAWPPNHPAGSLQLDSFSESQMPGGYMLQESPVLSPIPMGYLQQPNSPVETAEYAHPSSSSSSLGEPLPSQQSTQPPQIPVSLTLAASQPILPTAWNQNMNVWPSPQYHVDELRPALWSTPNGIGTQHVERVDRRPSVTSHSKGLGISCLSQPRVRRGHDTAAINPEILTRAGEEGRLAGGPVVRPSMPGVDKLLAGSSSQQHPQHHQMRYYSTAPVTHSYSASASCEPHKSPSWEASSGPTKPRKAAASRSRRSMPSLPSEQNAALALALAVDGKWSPPAESKRARRGAKQHQRRKSMGSPASVGVRKAATFAGGTAPPGEESGFQFMNFTMDHRESIIKGVAPSGSGKTKQRRDRRPLLLSVDSARPLMLGCEGTLPH